MFNQYIWKLYLESRGKEVVSFFEDNFTKKLNFNYPERIAEFHKVYCPDLTTIQENYDILYDSIDFINNNSPFYKREAEDSSLDIINWLINIIKENEESDINVLINFTNLISYYSTLLFFEDPELFFPYYFKYNFNFLKLIAEEFGIDLPPVPLKKDYLGRIRYYDEIVKALHKFRKEYDLSPYELCAFIYDFAPNYLGGYQSYIEEYDKPKGAYFIGAGRDDLVFQRNPNILKDGNGIVLWQCNPETKVGDALAMYMKTPISAINYIWRSVSKGFDDPFFYFYRCAYIADPKKIKPISLKKLRSDRTLKKMGIVRKNMQGVNGTEIIPTDYNHLLDIAKSDLDRIHFNIDQLIRNYENEKDFELNFLLPLVEKLNYNKKEFQNQLLIHVGNAGNSFKLIPDIVLLPELKNNTWNAYAAIEAKYSIKSRKELEEAQNQVKSYCRQLLCKYAVVASPEKIWIMSNKDDFKKIIFEESVSELNNPDVFRRLFKLLGKPES